MMSLCLLAYVAFSLVMVNKSYNMGWKKGHDSACDRLRWAKKQERFESIKLLKPEIVSTNLSRRY
jgi:hypothetical protein